MILGQTVSTVNQWLLITVYVLNTVKLDLQLNRNGYYPYIKIDLFIKTVLYIGIYIKYIILIFVGTRERKDHTPNRPQRLRPQKLKLENKFKVAKGR